MYKSSVKDMLNGRQSKYALVIAVAKRAREISTEYADERSILEEKPVLLALEEFKQDRFEIYEPEIND